jgi:glutamine amidotransferase-like uncharacterized protein
LFYKRGGDKPIEKQVREVLLSTQGVVAVYVDDGAAVGKVMRSVARELDPAYIVRAVLARDLDMTGFFDDIAVFIMPGGADLPYCRKLDGERNARLRQWVDGGGHYIGICAGAYYACAEVKFHVGCADEVTGPRKLSLLGATAVGSLSEIAVPYDLTLRSASVVRLRLSNGRLAAAHYHGGPKFEFPEGTATNILARYEDIPGQPAAVVESHFGRGLVLLSGVHAEVSAADLLPDVLASQSCEQYFGLLADLQNVETLRRQFWREFLSTVGLALADTSTGVVERVPSAFLPHNAPVE